MRTFFLFLFLFNLGTIFSEEPSPKASPLLTFSKTLPIKMDETNEAHSNQDESERNQFISDFKTLPWKSTLGIFVFICCLYFIKNFKQPLSDSQIKKQLLTSRQQALMKIEALKLKSLSIEDSYRELSIIVRTYIEEKTQIRAPHYTTQEFLSRMQESPHFSKETKKALMDFLIHTDQVKFARYQPDGNEKENSFLIAKRFIEN